MICLLVSCKREINVTIPDKTPLLVVNSEISADSVMTINLSLTQNITDNSAKPIVPDAFIEVFNKDTHFLDVLSYTSFGNYVGTQRSRADSTYLFRLSRGGTSYWVTQRIPDSVRCSLDTSRIIFQGKSNFFQIDLKLDDPSQQDNFYGLRVKRVYETYQGTDTNKQEEWVVLESIDFILTENPKTKFSKQNLLFTDQYFNGVPQSIKFGTSGLFGTQGQHTKMLIVYTTSYTREGYDYYTSVNEHLFYQNDPFSQPTLVKGNIPGIYGAVIGKYNRADTVRFK